MLNQNIDNEDGASNMKPTDAPSQRQGKSQRRSLTPDIKSKQYTMGINSRQRAGADLDGQFETQYAIQNADAKRSSKQNHRKSKKLGDKDGNRSKPLKNLEPLQIVPKEDRKEQENGQKESLQQVAQRRLPNVSRKRSFSQANVEPSSLHSQAEAINRRETEQIIQNQAPPTKDQKIQQIDSKSIKPETDLLPLQNITDFNPTGSKHGKRMKVEDFNDKSKAKMLERQAITENEKVTLLQETLKHTYIKEIQSSFSMHMIAKKKVDELKRQIEFLESEISTIEDSIEDTQEFTKERIADKVEKRRASKCSLADADENFTVEKNSIENEMVVLVDILGAKDAPKNDCKTGHNSPSFGNERVSSKFEKGGFQDIFKEVFCNDSPYQVNNASDQSQNSVDLVFKGQARQQHIDFTISEIDTSEVQKLKRHGEDTAYMIMHPEENYESDLDQAAQAINDTSNRLSEKCYRIVIKYAKLPKAVLKHGGKFIKYLVGDNQDKSIYEENISLINEYKDRYKIFYTYFPQKSKFALTSHDIKVIEEDEDCQALDMAIMDIQKYAPPDQNQNSFLDSSNSPQSDGSDKSDQFYIPIEQLDHTGQSNQSNFKIDSGKQEKDIDEDQEYVEFRSNPTHFVLSSKSTETSQQNLATFLQQLRTEFGF